MAMAAQYGRARRIDTGEALRMCSLYPARVMGMDDRIGLIRPGYLCNLVVMDPSLEVKNHC